jgi:quinohemoprotein ethanol dehydrogenase
VTAYSAQDGHRVWRFYNVPTPGDIGSGTWPNNSEWQVGGATVWNTPSVDPKTDIITYTTANPDPWAGRGPGDNLFAVSMVGVKALTGDYAWHFQIAHHELWDYDCPSPTVMFDAVVNGALRNIVAEPCKTGWLYEVDRTNGAATVTQIDEKPVPQNAFNNTSPTQPIPVGDAFAEQCPKTTDFAATAPDGQPYIIGCIWTAYDDKQFVGTAPGAGGGTVQAASTYSPQTGMFYVYSANTRQSLKSIPNASSLYRNGRGFTGIQSGGTIAGFQTTGDVSAYNPATNRIVWKQHFVPNTALGVTNVNPSGQPGAMSTGGNLLFRGIPEGVDWAFAAYNATTGAELWRSKTDAGIEASSPMAYAVNGVEYVAVYAGGRNTTVAPFTKGDSLYVYKLG